MSGARAVQWLLPVVVCGSGGCATSGHAWLQEPEPGFMETAAEVPSTSALPAVACEPPQCERAALQPQQHAESVAAVDDASFSAPRPRLSQVITLGETYATRSPTVSGAASPAPSPSPVIVQVFPGGAPGYGYYGVGPSFTSRASHSLGEGPVRSSGGLPPVGGDWSAPPSYGPAFPYRMAPASPWGSGADSAAQRLPPL